MVRIYWNSIKKMGGTVLKSDRDGHSYVKFVKGGKAIWARAAAGIHDEFNLVIEERKAMARTSSQMPKSYPETLKTTGHTAVYGFFFDSGKSDLKPESEAATAEVA